MQIYMDGYVGEIRLVAFGFAMERWHACNGAELPIQSYKALYSVIRNTYGGSTQKGTFRLPNLNNRYAIGAGDGAGLSPDNLGASGGAASVTLATAQMPKHTHAATFDPTGGTAPLVNAAFSVASAVPSTSMAEGCSLTKQAGSSCIMANAPGNSPAAIAGVSGSITPGSITGNAVTKIANTGGGIPIDIRSPYQAMLYVIALYGVFPPHP